jgi:hypothetical protein
MYTFVRLCRNYAWALLLGKAKSNAKTELEKLKMKDLTCAELIKETTSGLIFPSPFNFIILSCEKYAKTDSQRGTRQCCGSMTFWYGSGSADPCLWLK